MTSADTGTCKLILIETTASSNRFTFEAPMPTSRLVRDVADRAQIGTQRSWKRPWGVGLLVAGVDKNGVKLYYNCPSGNFYDYKAMAIGGRSQVRPYFLLS